MFGNSKDKHKNKVDNADIEQPSQTSQVTELQQSGQLQQPNQSVQSNRSKTMETLISESCKIEGNIQSEQSVKVEGRVEGNINVKDTLIISAKGQVVGDIIADNLIVYGHIRGDSQLKEIHIQEGGHIDGNIKTQSLNVDPKATYNGTVTMTKESPKPATSIVQNPNKSTDKAASDKPVPDNSLSKNPVTASMSNKETKS